MRPTTGMAISSFALVVALTACGEDGDSVATNIEEGVDTAQSCTQVVTDVAQIDFSENADPAELRADLTDLRSTVDGLEDPQVKQAAQGLVTAIDGFVSALPNQEQRQNALQEVERAAQGVADVCNVPVDEVVDVRS